MPLQLVLAASIFLVVSVFFQPPTLSFFGPSLALICMAALVENLCEPFYVAMLQRMDMSKRVKAEGAAIFAKSVGLYAVIASGAGERLGLLAFAMA